MLVTKKERPHCQKRNVPIVTIVTIVAHHMAPNLSFLVNISLTFLAVSHAIFYQTFSNETVTLITKLAVLDS
jgi:hypothetical protein